MAELDPTETGSQLLYCRPGFEKECLADFRLQAATLGVDGYFKMTEGAGFVRFFPQSPGGGAILQKQLRFQDLIFARQLIHVFAHLEALDPADRITPMMAALRPIGTRFSDVWLETADTNDAKSLSVLLRKLAVPLRRALEKESLLGQPYLPRLHLFFVDAGSVAMGLSDPNNAAAWPMGIPRLRFPRGAPSRSTLKLDEAFQVFVRDPDRELAPAMTAVDLGAAPGGWTWQLVKRHIRTVAVDNGRLDRDLLDSGIVEHVREDGFRYRPKKPVDWLVCDMVEQPQRIAHLVADWLALGLCRHAIFNLKLPMKQRHEMVMACRSSMESRLAAQGRRCRHFEFRQLYHDRAEVTGYISCPG
jgi:23S rRNA (cytidine2498-2'-O)-methyltransferase